MLTLAWDVDDVLNKLMQNWLELWWRPQHPDCKLNYEDINNNPPHQLLGVELDEYLRSLDDFRLSGLYEQMPPNPPVLDWFKNNGPFFRHIAVTAVPRVAASVSASWIMRHFGNWIRSFHFIPSARQEDILTTYESTKAEYFKWLDRIDMFIDDNPKFIHDAEVSGIRCFLVSQPWNCEGQKIDEILDDLSSLKTNTNYPIKNENKTVRFCI